MANESPNTETTAPDIFSRGSLKLTYGLIRKKDPQLALKVRNIIGTTPLPKEDSKKGNANADHFRINFDSFQVRAIVEGLIEQAQAGSNSNSISGIAVVAKALAEDWMLLARKMIDELPDDKKPPFAENRDKT